MDNPSYVLKKNISDAGLFNIKQQELQHLDIELTERCNNACMHCYINLPEHDVTGKRRELTTEQWKDILHQAADLGALSMRFTGGEPLLREDFAELYLYARRLGLKVVLFTNARLITPELADLFALIPPLKKIEISVYGMQAGSYDTVARSPGAYEEYRRGVELLLDRRVPFTLKSVLLPPNKDEVKEYESWIKRLPGDIKPSYVYFFDLRGRRDAPAKNCLIKRLRLSPEESLAMITRDNIGYSQAMAQFSEKFMYPQGDELFNCGAGDNGCVDAYGQYQMCMQLRHSDMVYDLTQGTLKKGLLEVFPRMRQMRASNPDYLQRCAKCFLKGLCEQCPAKSWMEYGTLDTPVEYLCQVAHEQGRFLGLLKVGELAWEVIDWQERVHVLANRMKPNSAIAKPSINPSGG